MLTERGLLAPLSAITTMLKTHLCILLLRIYNNRSHIHNNNPNNYPKKNQCHLVVLERVKNVLLWGFIHGYKAPLGLLIVLVSGCPHFTRHFIFLERGAS